MRTVAVLCLSLLLATPAAAQNYRRAGDTAAAPASKTLTITSPQKCYDQIGPAEAQDVRNNFERPYEECLRRLGEKLKRDQQAEADKAKATAEESSSPATTPHYYRVQKDKKDDAKKPAEKK